MKTPSYAPFPNTTLQLYISNKAVCVCVCVFWIVSYMGAKIGIKEYLIEKVLKIH